VNVIDYCLYWSLGLVQYQHKSLFCIMPKTEERNWVDERR